MTVLERLDHGARFSIIRLRSLGDCVLTTPAIDVLHRHRPDLQVGVVVEPRFRPIFEGNPAVSTLIDPTWQAVRKFKPTICLNLHGGSRSLWMTLLSGAKWRAGFAHHNFTFAYNLKIGRAQAILGVRGTVHTAEHLASAMFALGVPFQDVPQAQLFSPALPSPSNGRYAILHPFASTPSKAWPAQRFCELARYLALWKIEPLFLAGPGDNITPFSSHKVLQPSLTDTKSLISAASVFIGNDSGPAHMAAAFSIPTVVFFSTSNSAVWGPWRTESEVVLEPDGLQNLSVSRVVAALERLRIFEEAHA